MIKFNVVSRIFHASLLLSAICVGPCLFSTETSQRGIVLKEVSGNEEVVDKGKVLYQAFCLACHGTEDVTVDAVSNLFDDKWYRGGKPEEIELSIKKGYLDTGMPPWNEMLPEGDIESIVAYLLSFQKD